MAALDDQLLTDGMRLRARQHDIQRKVRPGQNTISPGLAWASSPAPTWASKLTAYPACRALPGSELKLSLTTGIRGHRVAQ